METIQPTHVFAVQDFKLRLSSGQCIHALYNKITNQQTGILPMHSVHAQSRNSQIRSPVLISPIKAYLHTPLVCRVHDLIAHSMRPLFMRAQQQNMPIHIHLPDANSPQARILNEKTLRVFFHDYYANTTLIFTHGDYLAELIKLSKQITACISGAIDCQTDIETLKQRAITKNIMTIQNDDYPAAGEGAVFLHLNQKQTPRTTLRLLTKSTNHPPLKPQNIIYPMLRNRKATQHLLKLERCFKSEQHTPAWISPENMCGSLGAATMPTCILLAYVDALKNQHSAQGLCFDEQEHAGLVSIEDHDE